MEPDWIRTSNLPPMKDEPEEPPLNPQKPSKIHSRPTLATFWTFNRKLPPTQLSGIGWVILGWSSLDCRALLHFQAATPPVVERRSQGRPAAAEQSPFRPSNVETNLAEYSGSR